MGSPCLFTRQQALKMGYFYWLRFKNSNHLHRELSLGYLKDTNFYLESKVSVIHISSIASFKSFLIAWLWGYCTFSDSSVVSLKSSPWPKYTKYETIFQKKIIFYYQTFFSSSNMFFIRLFLANTWKKIGGHRASFLTNCRGRWTRIWYPSRDGEFARWRLGRDTKWRPSSCSKRALEIKLVFGCF